MGGGGGGSRHGGQMGLPMSHQSMQVMIVPSNNHLELMMKTQACCQSWFLLSRIITTCSRQNPPQIFYCTAGGIV
jgi:hypothetical protein